MATSPTYVSTTGKILDTTGKAIGTATPGTTGTFTEGIAPQSASGSAQSTARATSSNNPHDAPTYDPATDPNSSVNNANPTPTALSPTPIPTTTPSPNQPLNTNTPNPATVQINPASTNQATPQQIQQVADATKTVQGLSQQIGNQYKQGLATTKAGGVQVPDNQGEASSAIQKSLPANNNYDSTQADAVIADNKAHTQYLQDFTKAQSSADQTKSLTQVYKDLSDQLGLSTVNTDLLNMKKVIDGTEDDIRNEITKAGGFATNSQVLALTTARNKMVIQNYNDLLQTRDDMQKNLTTMVGLAEQDRQYASQQIDKQLNFDQQNIQYADKALTNSQDALSSMQKTEGWDGILKGALATGDPQAVGRINSIMGNGFDLASMAQQDATARTNASTKTAQEQAQATANLANTKATTAKTNADIQKINEDSGAPNPLKANAPGYNANGIKYNTTNAQQEIMQEIKNQGIMGSRNLLPPSFYNQGKAWWVQQGLTSASYDDIFGGYKDPAIPKQYN